MLFMWTKYMG